MFVSCKDSLLNDNYEKENTATLYFSVNGSSARNILPDTTVSNFTDFVLTGKLNGANSTTELGTWNTVHDMLSTSVQIAAGSWELCLSAKRVNIDFTATTQVTVTAGQNATAAFNLIATSTENGIANITLRYPEKSNVALVYWSFTPVDDSSLYLNRWSSSDDEEEFEGYCFLDNTFTNIGEGIQEIKDTSFTLQKALPAGKYVFTCYFGSQIAEPVTPEDFQGCFAPLDDYYNYIVIQPGLESKLDYTIDYFELKGITNAVSTPQGIVLTIDIPKGIEDIVIQRITNYSEFVNMMYSNQTDEDMFKTVMVYTKILDEPTTSSATMTFVDSYGYTVGQELTYAVMMNYYSDKEMGGYTVTTLTPEHDGYEVPGFTTYPTFATESDQEGKTTKIKLTNEPVIDWKGHELNSNYILYLSRDADDFFDDIDYVFTKDIKENDVDQDDLYPGANPLSCYRIGFEKDGWYYNCGIDKTGLSAAQLPPVLYGRPCAMATNEGIDIKVHCAWSGNYDKEDNKELALLRATSANGNYITIKDFTEVRNRDYFEYLDRKNLEKDVTYYYKLVDKDGNTYGGQYFSATSSINFGTPVTITANPKLQISGNCLATFTPGTFQVDEHVKRIYICYEFTPVNNDNLTIALYKYRFKSDDEWTESDLYAHVTERYDDKGISQRSVGSYPDSDRNIIDFYYGDLDGIQFVFDKAYISSYTDYGPRDFIDTLFFTPGDQECTTSFVMHTDVILLSGDHSSNGITLNIRNIPQEADSISVRKQYINSYGDYELFRVNNLSSTSISLLDSYVNPNNNYYYYTVYAYKGDTSLDYATTLAHGFSTYGKGLGEIELTVSTADNTVSLQFSIPEGTSNPVIYRDGPSEVIITPASGKYAITDYFVQAGWSYNYSLAISIDYDGSGSIIYTPRSEKKSVDFSGYSGDFYNCPEITKVPEYTWNVDEANNFTMTFTGEPEVFKDNVLPEFTVSKLDLNFKYDDMHKVTIPYTGSNTFTYKLVPPGSFTYELQPDTYGIFTCDDYTYEGKAVISYDLLYMGEDTEKYWLKELPGYIEVN